MSVMAETQKNESPGWENCLLFSPLINPSMVSGWKLKMFSFKPAVGMLDATSHVWAAVDTGAQKF